MNHDGGFEFSNTTSTYPPYPPGCNPGAAPYHPTTELPQHNSNYQQPEERIDQQNFGSTDRSPDLQPVRAYDQSFDNFQPDNPYQAAAYADMENYGHRFTSAAVPRGVDPDLPYALPPSMNPLAHPAIEGRHMLQFRLELDRSMDTTATTVGLLIALRANVALMPDAGHGAPCYKAITQIDWADWLDRLQRPHATLVSEGWLSTCQPICLQASLVTVCWLSAGCLRAVCSCLLFKSAVCCCCQPPVGRCPVINLVSLSALSASPLEKRSTWDDEKIAN